MKHLESIFQECHFIYFHTQRHRNQFSKNPFLFVFLGTKIQRILNASNRSQHQQKLEPPNKQL